MSKLLASLSLLLLAALPSVAQTPPPQSGTNLSITSDGIATAQLITNQQYIITFSNNVVARYLTPDPSSNVVLTCDLLRASTETGDLYAEGNVRVFRTNETLILPRAHLNYLTGQIDGEQFRTGQSPVFVAGEGLHGEGTGTNAVYTATNSYVTTEDYDHPLSIIRAKEIRIVPGQYVEVHDATVYAAGIPVFFVPYYRRDLTKQPDMFSFVPGYRSAFGPYLLSSYIWSLNDEFNGAVHGDWRGKRGLAGGPDFNLFSPTLGDAAFRYYYAHDNQPGLDPFIGTPIPQERQRLYFSYSAALRTNLTVKAQVAYQTDPYVVRDFFESEYTKDTQPNTFTEINQLWRNWSLDVLTQPRVNPFFETVERLPDVRLTGFRQQVFDTPVFYESESSAGYYRRLFADTNLTALPYAAERADTFQQLTLPETLFGWLNVTPRVGGRFTHYSEASGPGATTTNEDREVFNTGAEVSFKLSQLWPAVHNHLLDVDGLRLITVPSFNYVYIPRPNVLPSQLPQFDYQPSNNLEMLPLEFPDYNAIDAIDSQNTLRFGLNNRLQTKRNGEVDDLVSWSVYTDWRLRTITNQTTFSDIYSDLELKPRSWLTLGSKTRYDIDTGEFNLAQHRITFEPGDRWSWTAGHFFLREGPLFGTGEDLISSVFFYRFNQNWGTRLAHYFDARTGNLQEQDYGIYRDMRSWTAALTFRALNSTTTGHDYAIAFTFSFKSFPRLGLGADTVSAASLLGR